MLPTLPAGRSVNAFSGLSAEPLTWAELEKNTEPSKTSRISTSVISAIPSSRAEMWMSK